MKKKKAKNLFTTDKVMPRYFYMATAFALLGLVIVGRAGYLMFSSKQDYWMQVSEKFKKYNIEIPAKRGTIYSADGQILSTTLPEYRLYMDFMSWEQDSARRINDQMDRDRMLYLKLDSVADGMHQLFPDIDPKEFKDLLLRGRAKKSHHWLLYSPRVTYVQYCKAKELPFFSMRNSGFHAEDFAKRKNPFGSLARATIGIYDEERNDKKTHKALMTGLENALDTMLRGTPGLAHNEKVLNRYVTKVDKPAEDGLDIVTTIDVGMQDLVEKTLGDKLKELDAEVGMCILMEVKTGDVKAMSSLTKVGDGVYREIDNRAVYSRREPGSVFKPMAFMVAFEDGKIDLNSGFNVGGGVREMYKRKMRDSDWRKGGKNRWISAVECIKYSSNVGVSALIDAAYHDEPEKFIDGLDRIGIRKNLHLTLEEYRPPKIRYPEKDKYGHWTNWSNTAIPWMSIGYETQIPPIQTLTFYNGVANGGVMLKPRFITAAKRGDVVVKEYPVEYVHPDRPDHMMCSQDALKKVKTCLEAVVAKSDCTGKDVYTPNFSVAGKTGTAQIWNNTGKTNSYIISFAGYFPANAPKYSMIVCIEKNGIAYGGSMCGPVFKKVAESIWARHNRANLSKARDSEELALDAPVVCNGNIGALSSLFTTLGISYSTDAKTDGTLVWGRNTSDNPRHAMLSADDDKKTTMPDITGYGLRDAVYRLERMGLIVNSSGYGRVVSQSIPAGQAVKPHQTVTITLSTQTKHKPRPKPAAPATTPDSVTTPPPGGEGNDNVTHNQQGHNAPA